MKTKDKIKTKREWVKTAIIIFLAIMLVLTFFSNTIMNYSLPEVSAQYSQAGNISEKIRGTGMVESNGTYEVQIKDTRVVKSNAVKTGDIVKSGQILFYLEEGEGTELLEAQTMLDGLVLEYEKALLTVLPDYSLSNLSIDSARDDLQKSINERNNLSSTNISLDTAKNNVNVAQLNVDTITARVETLQSQLSAFESEDYSMLSSVYYNKIKSAIDKTSNAQKTLDTAQKEQTNIENQILSGTGELQLLVKEKQRIVEKLEKELVRLKQDYENIIASGNDSYDDGLFIDADTLKRQIEDKELEIKYAKEDLEEEQKRLAKNQQLDTNLEKAKINVKNAENTLSMATSELETIKYSIKSEINASILVENDNLKKANQELVNAQTVLEDIQANGGGMSYDELNAIVKEKQRTLQELILNLVKTKNDDSISQQIANLDLEAKQKEIEKQELIVEKLKEQSSESTVIAKVDGVITAVNCTAGDTVSTEMPLAEISVTSKGYSVSISVTNEQAKKVKVGDSAEVKNFFDGDIDVVLSGIKPDTENPTTNKRLIFKVNGDVSAGQSLNLVLSGKTLNYDTIVPKSAIMEDKNGKFVLVVNVKSTPLGNRYMTKKVEVEVIASDDTSSAVSGGLFGSEFVITTSTEPLKSGMQVRMVES